MDETLIKFEQVILSSIFFNPSCFDKIKARLSSSDFFLPLNAHVFSAFNVLSEKNKPFTPEFVCAEINKTTKVDLDSVVKITGESPIVDVESYVEKIKEASNNRMFQQKLKSIESKNTNIESKVNELQEYLNDFEKNHITQDDRNNLEWIEYFKDKKDNILYKLGIDFLDNILNGGIELNQLVLISGDAESGKTTLTTQILDNLSKNYKTCFFNLEFPIYKYIDRRNKILDEYLRTNEITQATRHKMLENNIIIDSSNDIYDIQNAIIRNALKGVKFFFIDSQMCLSVPDFKGEEAESKKFEILQRLTHKYDIVIFLIVQTSKTDSEHPFGSKKGGHFASIIFRIEYDKTKKTPQDQRTIKIQKNKQTGNTKNNEPIEVDINKNLGKFYSLDSSNTTNESTRIKIRI